MGGKKDTKRTQKHTSKAMQKQKPRKPLGLFPNSVFEGRKMVKMLYHSTIGINTGVVQNQFGTNVLYRLNSIYQPRTSGLAYRAQGYDQITGIYGRYKVYGAKVVITINNPTQDGLFLGIRAMTADNVDYLSGEYIGPSRMKKWSEAIPINNTGSQVAKYEKYWDIGAMQGLTDLQFKGNTADFCANLAANPAKVPKLEIAAANSQDSTDASMNVDVKIYYYVQLYDRQTLANSPI